MGIFLVCLGLRLPQAACHSPGHGGGGDQSFYRSFQLETLMSKKLCANCGQPFTPRPQARTHGMPLGRGVHSAVENIARLVFWPLGRVRRLGRRSNHLGYASQNHGSTHRIERGLREKRSRRSPAHRVPPGHSDQSRTQKDLTQAIAPCTRDHGGKGPAEVMIPPSANPNMLPSALAMGSVMARWI